MHARTTLLAVLASATIAACADKAEPDLKRCEEMEAQQQFAEAIEACQLARSKDPESSAGKKAEAKIPVLEAAKRKREQEKAALLDQEKRKAEQNLKDLKEDLEAQSKKVDELDNAIDSKQEAKEQKCPPGDPLCSPK